MKRRVKRIYSRWRKGKIVRARYMEERKLYRKWLEKKQKEKKEEEEELKRIKRETKVWKFINKKKGNKTWNENTIGKEEWRRHFMKLLDGTELESEMVDEEEDKAIGWQEREEIEKKEMRRAIKKLKIKKAAGIDGIPMEAWK